MSGASQHRRTVVFAPDSFKGSIDAADAARALADGWATVDPAAELVLRPMADGGEGTLDAFMTAVVGAVRVPVTVARPIGDAHDGGVHTTWVLLPPTIDTPNGTAVVELASTSGIGLLSRLDPWRASTRGFGEAIVAALDHGVDQLVLAIGSSGSTDGGAGMLAALGARFVTASGQTVTTPSAHHLSQYTEVDLRGLRPRPPGGVRVLTDVDNPLTGPRGAALMFGPQKGFDLADALRADQGLTHYASLVDVDPTTPGAGAAGGTGFGLLVWGARLDAGSAAVAELIGLRGAVVRASVVVTGEGSYDGQSAHGKAPSHVVAVATAAGVPAMLVAGGITADADTTAFAASVALTDLAGSAGAALADPVRWLRHAGATLARRR